jgi:NADH-quinone oxidoreductase subunit M
MSGGLLLIIAFGGAFLTYGAGKISARLRDICAVLISGALLVMIVSLHGKTAETVFYSGFLGLPLSLRINTLAWFFALTVSLVEFLSIIFSLSYIKGKERADFYYLMMLLVNASMLGIVLSGDFLSFYIFWEIMSWSAFLLISYNRGPALAAGMKYIIMSIIGSAAMLVAMLSLFARFGTLNISSLTPLLTGASSGYTLFVFILFSIAFGIKNAILPFHPWLPPAHSEAPAPFSAVLSGILIKMGVYGFVLFFYVVAGFETYRSLGSSPFSYRSILLFIGAVTILMPTFIAVLQDDAKRLLAWSTIGQAGYIILGVAYGTRLSVGSGLFHFFNHAAFKALLFMAVGAVEYRTRGVRDLNSLGGLIKKMPITFVGALIGVGGLIGVPLTNGFVSKWMIYKTLILEGSPFLAFAALIGTWGTILYSYKLIHHMFLGQLPEQYQEVRPAPLGMQIPIAVLGLLVILFGILPGIPLRIVDAIGTSFGFSSLQVSIWGMASETGALNMLNLFAAILVGFLIVWLIFKAGQKAVSVDQENNYAAGAAIPRGRYHYTVDFYRPLYRMLTPYLRDVIDALYVRIAGWVQILGGGVRKIYTGYVGQYVMYIVLFLALLIIMQARWSLW